MYTLRKLRPERSYGWILLPFGVMALFLAFNISAAYLAGGAFFALYAAYSFLTFLRTANPGFMIVTLYQLSVSLVAFSWVAGLGQRPNRLALFFAAWMFFFAIWMILLAATKRLKWRGRDLLELAAASVEQAENGYTGRPLPVGKTDFTQQHILGFAEFARRHLMAATYVGLSVFA